MRLSPNESPKHGTCSVEPHRVEALVNELAIFCDDWEDKEHDQLTYSFWVQRYSDPEDWYPLYYGPHDTGVYSLGPWSAEERAVKVFMYVEDKQGGRTLANEE